MRKDEQPLSEQESLRLITEMIGKAKTTFHESGTGAILWGSVVGFCGLMTFAQNYFGFSLGFDVWILALLALIPQVIITIKEKRKRKVTGHQEEVLNVVWTVYAISLFALIAYCNVIPYTTQQILADNHLQLLQKNTDTGVVTPWKPYAFSSSSLMMIIYAFPTLVTGISRNFKPMIYGGVVCYMFFLISLFTNSMYDALLNGLAGISNWLIPGLILWYRYKVNVNR